MTRPARITQAHVERAIKAAKRQGATAVDVRPDGTIHITLEPSEDMPKRVIEPTREVIL